MAAPDDFRLVLEAISFAARAHRHQFRKDERTPYVSHAFRVCLTLRHVFGIADPKVLATAVLHDTIEDTTTDFDDIEEHFGAEVASWVSLLSKDKRLRDDQREKRYMEGLKNAPWQVQVCKLADIHDNLLDSAYLKTPEARRRALRRTGEYLKAIQSGLCDEARPAFEIVAAMVAAAQGPATD